MPKIVGEAVIPIMERMICDCGGEMKASGATLLSKPPLYPHRCDKCGATESVRGVAYPRIKYE